jgi:hypothetical protein
MRRLAVAISVALSVALPGGVSADPTSTCPDDFLLVPAFTVENGAAKDKNDNGWVCVKYEDGGFKGGPNDMLTDDTVV